jgi:hypothetical protein
MVRRRAQGLALSQACLPFPLPRPRAIGNMVNGTFDVPASYSPPFCRDVAAINKSKWEFRGLLVPYGLVLLTMIKIVLKAAISFASRSQ